MKEKPTLVLVEQKIYDDFLRSSLELCNQMQTKINLNTEPLTTTEIDFLKAFLAYSKQLLEKSNYNFGVPPQHFLH